jgi:rfaE bifunctional protein nucleotidyltransferase chain/domain
MSKPDTLQLQPPENLQTLGQLVETRRKLKDQGKKVVLTNGCFDLLHIGHLAYLQAAKQLGDILWIGLNGSQSIRALKGPSRPILNDRERALMLAGLRCVDAIFIFDTLRLTKEILAIQPDIYTKAGDYSPETLDPQEYAALKQVGAVIHFLPFIKGYSSTQLIKKIHEAF